MKYLRIFLLFLLVASAASAQDATLACNDRDAHLYRLYRQAHESLASGNTKAAVGIFRAIIGYYERQQRLSEVSENYLGMALAFALNGNHIESIRYHKKALRAHRKYRKAEPADAILFNLGLAYQLAGREKKSRRYLARA